MTVGRGTPFQSYSVAGFSCIFFDFPIPSNTTNLEVVLEGSAASPGAGYMTFMMRQKQSDWMFPGTTFSEPSIYQEPPSEQTVMAEDDPAPGIWQVWVWPHGVVADQTWDLTVSMEGTGTEPDLGALGTDEFFC